ncbi:MAG: alpha/beta hydrolase [Vicinamibacterales bacterium]
MVRLVRMLGSFLIALAILLLLLWAGQRSLMYLPIGTATPPSDAGLPEAEELSVKTSDGLSLGAWFLRPGQGRALASVIVFNGNAGNRSFRAPLARRLADAGFNVCLFDYRGYGGNAGSPSEEGLLRDARAVVATVARRPDVEPDRIILLGESLGTGVAVALAAEVSPLALVLRSPFTSMTDVAAHHYRFLPVRQLLWDRYDSLSRVRVLTCPVAIVAGDGDRVVPYALSRRLFDALPEPKRFITVRGADHNDFALNAGDDVVGAVRWAAEAALARAGR